MGPTIVVDQFLSEQLLNFVAFQQLQQQKWPGHWMEWSVRALSLLFTFASPLFTLVISKKEKKIHSHFYIRFSPLLCLLLMSSLCPSEWVSLCLLQLESSGSVQWPCPIFPASFFFFFYFFLFLLGVVVAVVAAVDAVDVCWCLIFGLAWHYYYV